MAPSPYSESNSSTLSVPTAGDDYLVVQLVGYALYLLISLSGGAGNLLVIISILASRALRHKYILLVALAGGDMCNAVAFFIAGVIRLALIVGNKQNHVLKRADCMRRPYMPLYILGNHIPASIELLVAIDRVYVMWILLQLGKIPKKTSLIAVVASVIVYCYGFAAMIGAFVTVEHDEANVTSMCTFEEAMGPSFGTYDFSFSMTCASISFVIYVGIFVLFRAKAVLTKAVQPAVSLADVQAQVDLTKMMGIVIVFSLLIFIVPPVVSILLLDLFSQDEYSGSRYRALTPFFGAFACLNSTLNVFVYATRNENIRAAFVAKLCFWRAAKRERFYKEDTIWKSSIDTMVGEELNRKRSTESDFELPRQWLSLTEDAGHRLGTGAYGDVYLATLRLPDGGKEINVAVKRQREPTEPLCVHPNRLDRSTSERQHNLLLSEVKTLWTLGAAAHVNVADFYGIIREQCTILPVIAYCPRGSLLQFLRNSTFDSDVESLRSSSENGRTTPDNPQTTVESVLSGYTTAAAFPAHLQLNGSFRISTGHLLAFGYQVSTGMHFLSTRDIIHGDLAARNLLLCEGDVVKIGDFGLAYCRGQFCRNVEIPIASKWTAVEVLQSHPCTAKSDVWSFGVVLFELFTLGREPYAALPSCNLLQFLLDGYRLELPSEAPHSVKELASQCFSLEPNKRPTFSNCQRILSRQLRQSYPEFYSSIQQTLLTNAASDRQQAKRVHDALHGDDHRCTSACAGNRVRYTTF